MRTNLSSDLFRCHGYEEITHVDKRATCQLWYRHYLHEIDRKEEQETR